MQTSALAMAVPYLLGTAGATALAAAIAVRLLFRRHRNFLDTEDRRR